MALNVKLELVLYIFVLSTKLVASESSDPVVTTKYGRIVGTTLQFEAAELQLKTSINAFLGIPYAEPPVGTLRFKPPVPKTWSGELRATTQGSRCQQPKENIFRIDVGGTFDEDCLNLDVFVPTPKPINAAVMIWIHGGGYFSGAGTINIIHPSPLVAIGDIIVVTLNYRLGPFGFLTTEDTEAPGNVGMLDQIEAMRWVQNNIADFGGDVNRVTIAGESAGGSSVSLHSISPLSRGLFSRAIMQSGSALAPWAISKKPGTYRQRAFQFGSSVGCHETTSEGLIACLQNVAAADIAQSTPQFGDDIEGFDELLFFNPTIDGLFLPDNPENLLAKGMLHDIDIIIGETADDGMLPLVITFTNSKHKPHLNAEAFDNLLRGILKSDPILYSAVKTFYLESRAISNKADVYFADVYGKIATDSMFVCPGNKESEAYVTAGRTVYRYRLNHLPSMSFFNTTWEGVCHCEDLLFVFGAHFYKGNDFVWTKEEADMAVNVMQYWSNFVKTGNPNLASIDDEPKSKEEHILWPQFTIHEPAFKDFSLKMRNGHALKAKECTFWNDFVPQIYSMIDDLRMCKRHWSDERKTCAGENQFCQVEDATP